MLFKSNSLQENGRKKYQHCVFPKLNFYNIVIPCHQCIFTGVTTSTMSSFVVTSIKSSSQNVTSLVIFVFLFVSFEMLFWALRDNYSHTHTFHNLALSSGCFDHCVLIVKFFNHFSSMLSDRVARNPLNESKESFILRDKIYTVEVEWKPCEKWSH